MKWDLELDNYNIGADVSRFLGESERLEVDGHPVTSHLLEEVLDVGLGHILVDIGRRLPGLDYGERVGLARLEKIGGDAAGAFLNKYVEYYLNMYAYNLFRVSIVTLPRI